jgi:porphobilinogen synthase
MPGHAQRTVDRLETEVVDLDALGVRSVLLFGIPDEKDETGSGAWIPPARCRALSPIKRRDASVTVIADVCLRVHVARSLRRAR